ncbi:MAG: cation:proton antiporter [Tyzzerella sp.]|uniref:Cation:proton antiporter n=1 Tax=Candidatus Fimicola merdigallinarum TaxID=2840819 RepID=A0A9D9DWK2_9FIRM|nr:cation:proton antiporter [Candidatus Fimicola merdigallinarum]
MLLSLALIFILGIVLGGIFSRLKIPSILGMLVSGIILGPYALNLISPKILDISAELRQIALIIILTRAGLALDINSLKKVGKSAVLMCFVPATFEMLAFILIAPHILGINIIESAIMGAVMSAVSPAVIVPRMLKLIDEKVGTKKGIPQLIMAGASVDDIFVIVLFTAFLSMAEGGSFSPAVLLSIPISILTGVFVGVVVGLFIEKIFRCIHIRDSVKVLLILSVSFIFTEAQSFIENYVAFSGLLAVMSLSGTIYFKNKVLAKRLSDKFNRLWVGGEILLFVLVGASVNISYAISSGLGVVLVILIALVFRTFGVLISVSGSNLNIKEKLFCMIAYMPKATVQAGIGSIPLSMGLACGNIVLTGAIMAILITAPLGAVLIDCNYKKLLLSDKK